MRRSCRDAVAQIYAYLDEEIGWYKHQRIRWHLRRCSPCEGAFHFERHFKQVIRRHSHEAVPPEFLDRLRAFLREHEVGEA